MGIRRDARTGHPAQILRATLLQLTGSVTPVIAALNRILSRKAALHLLAVLLLLAQTLGAMHRVAHAGQGAAPQVAAAAQAHDGVWNDLFGHDAGTSCDDWNAAFASDTNPGSGSPDVAVIAVEAIAPVPVLSHYLPATPHGFSLARAPPRA